jgi:hypothetical protein
VESELPCEASVPDAVVFVEFADGVDGFVRDRGIVVSLPDSSAVLVHGNHLGLPSRGARRHQDRFRAFRRVSARLNSRATFWEIPARLAKAAL